MLPAILITFRETLEAALVVGIILTFLTKTNQLRFKKFVWVGVGLGVLSALLMAFTLEKVFGGLYGDQEAIFEGVFMFITAGFLTWMIIWVHQQKDIAKKIRDKVALNVSQGYRVGLVVLVVTSVLREGVETALYLTASSKMHGSVQIGGALIGIMLALLLVFTFSRWAMRVSLKTIFSITSVLLLLFAAGLVAHGVHEFQEVGLLPTFSFDPLVNLSHILDHNSPIGSILRSLFGYTSKPTILEITAYTSYIALLIGAQKLLDRFVSSPRKIETRGSAG